MDQRARQVIQRIERGETDDQVKAALRIGFVFIEPAGRFAPFGPQLVGQIAGPITDYQRPAWFDSQEANPLDHVLDHVAQQIARGIGTSLQR